MWQGRWSGSKARGEVGYETEGQLMLSFRYRVDRCLIGLGVEMRCWPTNCFLGGRDHCPPSHPIAAASEEEIYLGDGLIHTGEDSRGAACGFAFACESESEERGANLTRTITIPGTSDPRSGFEVRVPPRLLFRTGCMRSHRELQMSRRRRWDTSSPCSSSACTTTSK